jgi:predicted lipoprotein with Yx(FWY)xxD motif
MQVFPGTAARLLAIGAGLMVAACGGTTGSNTGGPAVSASSSALIHTQSMKVGDKTETVLKNSKGLTLYYFTPDTATTVACTGGCATSWPPLMANNDTPTSSPSLPGKLGVVDGANGKQVAYNGHPLYTYSKDGDSGDAYGQGIAGKWFVATPELAAASASASPSQSPSGY